MSRLERLREILAIGEKDITNGFTNLMALLIEEQKESNELGTKLRKINEDFEAKCKLWETAKRRGFMYDVGKEPKPSGE